MPANSLVVYDRRLGQFISGVTGRLLTGGAVVGFSNPINTTKTSWADWKAAHPDTRRVVLLMSPVNRIDFSGLNALQDLHELLHGRGIRLDLSEVKGPVLDALQRSGWTAWFDGRVFLSHHQAMRDAGDAAQA